MQTAFLCILVLLATFEQSVTANDEIVDIKLEPLENGEMRLEFESHARKHRLHLKESGRKLADIPLHPIGMDSEEFIEELAALEDIKMMRDTKYGSSFAIRFDSEGTMQPRIHSGVYQLGSHEFSIAPVTHTKVLVSKNLISKSDYPSKGRRLPEAMRTKRSIPIDVIQLNATVELLFVIDYELWLRFNDLTALYVYFAHLAQMMDVSYNNIQNNDFTLRIDLSGMVVLMNETALPMLVEDLKFPVDEGCGVDGIAVLDAMTLWLSEGGSELLPPYDHVMVLSGCDLFADGSNGLLGIAWLSGICNQDRSTSVVEVLGLLTEIAVTATHELGHSLGADHDGVEGSAEECPDENFIMAAFAGNLANLQNKYLFSCCSQRSFYALIRSVSCLSVTSAEPNFPPSIISTVENELPGQRYDADDQCFMAYGTTACLQNENICLNIACVSLKDAGSCIMGAVGAADGTTCDTDKWCYQGQCVPTNSTPPPLNLNCNVADCYGDERRCKGGVNTYFPDQGRFLCYKNSFHCDNFIDCSCGSDEINCNATVECGEAVHANRGSFSSPGFPENYPDNALCQWAISVDAGKVVEAVFTRDAEVEDDGITCSFDNIRIEGAADGYPTKLCGLITAGTKIVSEGNTLNVTFTTDASVNFAGWRLQWIARCAGDDANSTDTCDNMRKPCSSVTRQECNRCDEVLATCCNTCSDLTCIDTGSPKCLDIQSTCDPIPSFSERKACKKKCKKALDKCCSTCCRLFPSLC